MKRAISTGYAITSVSKQFALNGVRSYLYLVIFLFNTTSVPFKTVFSVNCISTMYTTCYVKNILACGIKSYSVALSLHFNDMCEVCLIRLCIVKYVILWL